MKPPQPLPSLLLLSTLLAATPARAADPLAGVDGYGKLDRKQREAARDAASAIACYHGCKGTVAACLARKPRVATAWRLARYIVYLAGYKLDAELIARIVDRRRQSVHPDKVHEIKSSEAPLMGDARAPLVIVEYADFECRHCAALVSTLEKLIKSFRGRVALRFKVYPLRFKGPTLLAARAALAAQRQGKFWQMAHLLFKDPDNHTEKGVEQLAREVGLDLSGYRAAMKDTNLLKQIERNKIEGLRLGIKGTPTLFFNGKPHLLRKDEHHLRDRIEEELELLGR